MTDIEKAVRDDRRVAEKREGDAEQHHEKEAAKREENKEKDNDKSKKSDKKDKKDKKDKDPPGGRDRTLVPRTQGKTYTVRFVFHSASDIPMGDMTQASSDPYVLAQLNPRGRGKHGVRHARDPLLRFRSATAYSTTHPVWDAEWVVAGIPAAGGELKVRVYDEDNGSSDDRLGTAKINLGVLDEGWKWERRTVELKKRGGSFRAWGFETLCAPCVASARRDATITLSAEVLGETEDECGKAYTLNSWWWIHYSPLMGAMVGTTVPDEDGDDKANFAAVQFQLRGPVPNELYHRYVEFKAFVHPMFEARGLRGYFMHRVVHAQHQEVYHFDRQTEYGRLPGPGKKMAQCFLDLTAWGEGYRIFTYVITLDGLMRFTETGKEFAIDMLSKHTMHSDVNIYTAFSGEFFVRKWKGGRRGEVGSGEHGEGSGEHGEGSGEHGEGSEEHGEGSEEHGEGHSEGQQGGSGPHAHETNGTDTPKFDTSKPSHSMLAPPRDAETEGGEIFSHPHEHHLAGAGGGLDTEAHKESHGHGHRFLEKNSKAEWKGRKDNWKDMVKDREHNQQTEAAGNPDAGAGASTNPANDAATDATTADGTANGAASGRQPKSKLDSGPPWHRNNNGGRPVETTHLHGRSDGTLPDPSEYELVIDNDSGTYRPDDELLPVLAAFLRSNFVGLHVTAKSCKDDDYQDVKKKRREDKEKHSSGRVYAASSSDLSSIASGSDRRGNKEKGLEFITNPTGVAHRAKDKVGGVFHRDKGEENEE